VDLSQEVAELGEGVEVSGHSRDIPVPSDESKVSKRCQLGRSK
jgi:hypothetical protein